MSSNQSGEIDVAINVGSDIKNDNGTVVARYDAEEVGASCCSKIFYTWASPIFRTARQKKRFGEELESEDLFTLPQMDHTNDVVDKFNKTWLKYMVNACYRLMPFKPLSRILGLERSSLLLEQLELRYFSPSSI